MDKGDKQRERREESDRVKMSVAAATAPETRIQRKLQVAAVKQGIRGNKVSTESVRTKTIISKMEALKKIKDIIVETEGEDSYRKQMLELRNELMIQPEDDDNEEEEEVEDSAGL